MLEKGIGQSVKRKEDFRFITGRGNYTDDINLPHQLYAYFLRSPIAHAKLNSVNIEEALKTFKQRSEYGNTYSQYGEILESLFPNGENIARGTTECREIDQRSQAGTD